MRRLLLPFAVLFAAACKDGSGPEPVPYCKSAFAVVVDARAGEAPSFSWKPACRVALVEVWRISPTDQSLTKVWMVSNDTSGIAPAVRYGVTPSGARVDHAAEPLTAGVRHVVVVFPYLPCPPDRPDCSDAEYHPTSGSSIFTP